MTFIIGQAIPIRYYQGATGTTIKARVIDESDGVFGFELTLVENAALNAAGHPGLYEHSFTPDAAGTWKVILYYGTTLYGQVFYDVGGGLSVQEKADVEAEAIDALESFDLDHVLAVAGTGTPVVNSFFDYLMNKDGGQTFDRTTDSLEFLGETIAAILTDVTAINGDAMRGTDAAATAAIWTNALATALAAYTALRGGYLDELAPGNLPTDVANIDAAIVVIDAFHDVAVADAVTNLVMSDVIGAKDDTLAAAINATNSLMRYMKGALGAGWTNESLRAIYDEVVALMWQAGPGVPTADSMLDYIMNIDPGQTFDRTTDSLEALGTAVAALGPGVGMSPTDKGMTNVLVVSVTDALNAGVTVIATVGSQDVIIDSIVLHADTAAHADMTTCAIEGGVGQVVEFIGVADAIEANLDAADKQVWWKGAVGLKVGKTITIDLQGAGANAADLTVYITYHACVDGGVLA